MTGGALRFVDAIAFEARGRAGVGSRRPGRGRVGVLVAAALLAGVAVVAAAALVGVRGGVSSARSSARVPAAGGFARLPAPLRGLVSRTLGRSERAFWVRRAGAGFVLVNGAQGFSARFSDSGVRVYARAGRLALSLAGVGYGSSLRPLGSRAPSADGNRVSYADGPLTQWFENGPLGLEQGFTLRAPPAGAARGPVTIALRVAGSLRARLVGGGEAVDFIAPGGRVVLRYMGLRALDARGRVLRAWLDASGGRLLVRVDARGARYPLRIDPFIQQGAKLVGTGAVGDPQPGRQRGAVGRREHRARRRPLRQRRRGGGVGVHALGGDLDPAGLEARRHRRGRRRQPGLQRGAVGRREHRARRRLRRQRHGVGAVWVFTRSGRTWTQQGPKLVGTGAAGARRPGLQRGAVGRREHGARRRQLATTASLGRCGCSRARGRPGPSRAQSSSAPARWSTLCPTPAGLQRGAVVRREHGARRRLPRQRQPRASVGAAWVFTRSGTTWTQQGPKLVGTGAAGDADQGVSVALSGDGNTALVGGAGDNGSEGAAWVFTRSGTTWTQQGSKLVGTGAVGDRQPGLQRGAVVRREHRARRRPRRQRHQRGGGVGVHALGDDLDPAGPKARRHRRRPATPPRA